ncbi:HDOD domain-containing protein [Marinobacter sp. C2H3]|uniref:HDOD domain-containing protein n=1 Tax=Marinobacter sp. C2H3 TaxID=3119003 RepID=UPI00300EDB33
MAAALPIAPTLEAFLQRKGLAWEVRSIESAPSLEAAMMASGYPQTQCLEANLMVDIQGVVMVVHRFDAALDPDALAQLTGRRLQPLSGQQSARLMPECDPDFTPPLGAAFDMPVLLDADVADLDPVVFSGGRSGGVVVMSGRDFRLAMAGARKGHLVIRGPGRAGRKALSLEEVADRLQKLYRLPPMPALALRILRLTANSEATARELSELIELDPSLTAQIMRYARSALFHYPGQINTVQDAVTRVLGFDRVAHIALGIASVRAFDVPRNGPLGLDAFWRHSLYCAFMCQALAKPLSIDKGLAYLCGLLHNFGLLLVGHLFPAEFEELNQLRDSNPDASLHSLEQQVFGREDPDGILSVGHGAIGGILHRLWQLPDPVIKAAGLHQHAGYQGDGERFVLMVQLANALLKERGIGDELNADDVPGLVRALQLSPDVLVSLNEETDRVAPDLDSLALSLAS